MKISSYTPTFGASFVDNERLRKVTSKAKFNKETETLAKEFANLPQKDKLEIVYYDYYTGSIYDHVIEVKVKNLTTEKSKVFRGHGNYGGLNIINDLLESIIDDAKAESSFWSKLEDQKVINILTGKE